MQYKQKATSFSTTTAQQQNYFSQNKSFLGKKRNKDLKKTTLFLLKIINCQIKQTNIKEKSNTVFELLKKATKIPIPPENKPITRQNLKIAQVDHPSFFK